MQCDFYQRNLLEKKWFTFTDAGLRIKHQKLLKTHDYELKYEEIGTKKAFLKGGSTPWLIATIILTAVSLIVYLYRISGGDVEPGAEFLYLSFALLTAVLYLMTFKNARFLAKINNVGLIEFLNNKPSVKEVDLFIDEIISRRREFLLQRYGQLNRNLSYEPQHNHLTWLLNNDVFTEEEYHAHVAELDSLFPSITILEGFAFGKN